MLGYRRKWAHACICRFDTVPVIEIVLTNIDKKHTGNKLTCCTGL